MLFNNRNYDDEQVKLGVLDERVGLLLGRIKEGAIPPNLVEALALAMYALVLAQIEAFYWQSPHLARVLRTWVTVVLQTGSQRLDGDCIIFYAIKNNMPAEQLESLLEILNE